eukprot:5407778-Amphidinium_carterae.1
MSNTVYTNGFSVFQGLSFLEFVHVYCAFGESRGECCPMARLDSVSPSGACVVASQGLANGLQEMSSVCTALTQKPNEHMNIKY